MQEWSSTNELQNQIESFKNQEKMPDVRQLEESETAKIIESKPAPVQTKNYTKINDRGLINPEDTRQLFAFADAIHKAGFAPKAYDTPSKILIGMQYARELGLEPVSGLRNIAVVNGSPTIFGELPLKLAYQTKELEKIEEFVIDENYEKICVENKNLKAKPWAGVCLLKRKNFAVVEGTFTMDEAEAAKLLGKSGPWQTYPKVMLMRRARANALKIAFPDAIGGASIAEQDWNTIPDDGGPKDVTRTGLEKPDIEGKLNKLFEESPDKEIKADSPH